jgi:hypothetical protein
MNKYFVLFGIPVASMDEWMKGVSPEERKKQSEDLRGKWDAWMQGHAAAFVDRGAPLGKTKRVTKRGVSDTRNDLNWYCVVQADSHEAAAQLFADHPQIQVIDTATIDVMEMPRMGM